MKSSSRIILYLLFLSLLFLFQHCAGTGSGEGEEGFLWHPLDAGAATAFRLDTADGIIRASVLRPWQGEEQKVLSYYLTKKAFPAGADTLIHVPVRRVVVTSTTHVAYLTVLNEEQHLVGISGTRFVYNPKVRQLIASGRIKEIGYDANLDYELIVHLRPDVVFLYGVGAEVLDQIERLKKLGIPAVMVGDYLENTPLGRTAWLRFFGCFFDKEREAALWTDSITRRYRQLIRQDTLYRPLVMTGLPWNEIWYVSGGESLLATLIRDAGGHYVWEHLPGTDAYPMDIEKVFREAGASDLWINCGNATSLASIRRTDERLILFRPYRKGTIYNNDRRTGPGGGNDYWESGAVHPDLLLQDLITIFHARRDSDLNYYRKLQ